MSCIVKKLNHEVTNHFIKEDKNEEVHLSSKHQNSFPENGCSASLILHAAQIISNCELPHDTEDSFYIVDTGAAVKLYQHLKDSMPRVTPHYAVKCFPNQKILEALANAGAGFDCASKKELEMVMKLEINPSRVIFANPCKRRCDFMSITNHNVQYTTFDSIFELDKIKDFAPNVGAVLRIRADDPKARMPFGVKYGALTNEVIPLLLHAKTIGVNICGVAFHVGSGAGDAMAYDHALKAARQVYDLYCKINMTIDNQNSKSNSGNDNITNMTVDNRGQGGGGGGGSESFKWVVDMGGGFDGGFTSEGEPFVGVGESGTICVAKTVNHALDTYFPIEEFPLNKLKVISEPGRYLARSSACLLTRVIGKRVRIMKEEEEEEEEEEEQRYIDEVVDSNDSFEQGRGGGGGTLMNQHLSFVQQPPPSRASFPSTSSLKDMSASASIDSSDDGSDARLNKDNNKDMPFIQQQQQQQQPQPKNTATIVSSDYYIADGTYGAFNAILYDGWIPSAIPFTITHQNEVYVKKNIPVSIKGEEERYEMNHMTPPSTSSSPITTNKDLSSIFGPTCDSLDMIFHNIQCPSLEIGDWLLFPNSGAYTLAGACDFNGIPSTISGGLTMHYISSNDFAMTQLDKLLPLISSVEPPMSVLKNF